VNNKAGVECKTLHITLLEKVYWNMIQELKTVSGKKTDADAIRWALMKATGRA
jgi:hypothetical protein